MNIGLSCDENLDKIKISSLSNEMVYLNVTQHQIYTASKLKKLYQKWVDALKYDKMSNDTFEKLSKTHFENLKVIPKYHTIHGRNHSTQCSYATKCSSCKCWCEGVYHGRYNGNIIIHEVLP